jgi:hypothetical protein
MQKQQEPFLFILTKNDLKIMKENGTKNWSEDLQEVMEGIHLFVNSKVTQAEQKLRGKFGIKN